MHFKNSDCILSALQIFGPILVAGPNVFVMLKTFRGAFEVEKYRTAFEVYSYCILNVLTAFQQHSKHSNRIARQATSNSARMS